MADEISHKTKIFLFDLDMAAYNRLKKSFDEAKLAGYETEWIETRMEKIRNKYI